MQSRRLTHVSNAVGQVVRSLTHIPVFVSCNQERKHCPAHSLSGWSNGSRQRAGQSWSQCQRTISGEHTHTKREHRRDPPVCLNDTVSRSPRHWGNYAEKSSMTESGITPTRPLVLLDPTVLVFSINLMSYQGERKDSFLSVLIKPWKSPMRYCVLSIRSFYYWLF